MTHILELSKEEINQLLQIIYKISYSPSETPELYCEQLNILKCEIPQRIKEVLADFKKKGSPTGFLLVKTIPIDENLPKTPPGNFYHIGETTTLAKIQSLLLSFLGEMIAYEAEGNGRLFQDVVPIKSMENEQTSLGSNKELEIHTEQAFSTLRPDILSLACLRSNPEARTYILPVNSILTSLQQEEIEMLREPLWKTGVDLSFRLNNKEFLEGDVRGPMAILRREEGKDDPFLVFDQDLMTGITEGSQQRIQQIVDIYYAHRLSHVLQPGNIIFIDNNRAVHGRSPFTPNYDGYDRFLIRCFATFDYGKSEYARKGRMVEAVYS
jgi:L-asparagine oxygenase